MITETAIVMIGLYCIARDILEQRRRETKTGEFEETPPITEDVE